MADDTPITTLSPDDWKKSYVAKKGGAATSDPSVKTMPANDWKASYLRKKQPPAQTAGQLAKMAGQNVAVQGAGIAPIIAGAELGGTIGAAGGPFDIATIPIGALAGAGLGAMTSPAARYYMGKLVGSEQPKPTVAESNYEAKLAALTEAFGPAANALSTTAVDSMFDALVGRSEVLGAGTKAAESVEQQNLSTQEALAKKADAERAAQKTSSAQAAEQTGQKNLAARADAAQKASQQQAKFQQAHEDAVAKADKDFQQSTGKLQEQIIPEAKQETVAGSLGRTPEQTRTGRFDPNVPQQRAVRTKAIFDAKNQAQSEFGTEYEKTFGPYKEKPIGLSNTAGAAKSLLDQAEAGNWQLAPATKKLLLEAQGMSAPEAKFNPQEFGISQKEWAKKTPADREIYLKLQKRIVAEPGSKRPIEQSTIGQAMGLRSKFGDEMSSAQGVDGFVARQMRDALLKDLDGANVPRAQELNNRYRAFRNGGLGDFDFLSKVSDPKGGEMHTLAPEIFGNPQRGTDLVKRLTPEQKADFRDLYADYINTGGKISPDHAPILQELGFKGPLTKPDSWVYADKQVANLDEVFATSPNARAKLTQQVQAAKAQKLQDFNNEVIKQGYKDAAGLGMTGDRIKQAMDAAKTPAEKADVAIKMFNQLTPGQAAQDLSRAQQSPGMAAFQASQQAPRTARTAQQGFQPESADPAIAQAIQQFSPTRGRWSGYLLRRAAFSGIGGGSMLAATGRVTPMVIGAGGAAAAVLTRDAISAGWRYSIQQSPEAALQFYRALQNPGTEQSIRTISNSIVDATLAQQMAQHGQPTATPTPAPKTTTKVGPMVKHIEEKKAENIAGPRGALSPTRISTIQDTSKQIAAGSAPDIQSDLRNGRMSHSDVAKMLKPDKPGLAALFQGLTPQQAVDAFAHANPQEREMTLPALAQHLQDSKLPKEKMASILQQLKAVMAPQQQEGEEA